MKLVYLSTHGSPFSFFRYIFIPPHLQKSKNRNIIIDHELIHSKHLHSLDIILSELFAIFQWFNPCAWFFNKSMKQNHEFVVDAEVLKRGYDKTEYQYTLLKETLNHTGLTIAN